MTTFYQRLLQETSVEHKSLLTLPIINECEELELADYVAFLAQSYHHTKHTLSLLMNVGAKLTPEHEWLQEAIAIYIEEEIGHQECILHDIEQCGFDKELIRRAPPQFETQVMTAYSYDAINRISPLSYLGLVHVLESVAMNLASDASNVIASKLNLPNNAFSYLSGFTFAASERIAFFETLANHIESKTEQDLVITYTKAFYRLYTNIFNNLHPVKSPSCAA